MTRYAVAIGARQRSCGGSSCAQRVTLEPMAALRLLVELLAIPLSNQKTVAKWLVIPQSAGCASNVSEAQP